jgi:tripeptide aminopeptidase
LLRAPRFAINVDGGAPECIYIEGIGAADWRVTVQGIPAHTAAHPEDAVSAVAVTALALASLHRSGWHGRIEQDGDTGTANVGAIRGGDPSNAAVDTVEISGEARSHDQAFLERILDAIETAFSDACREVANQHGEHAKIDIHRSMRYQPFKLPADCLPVRAISEHASASPSLESSHGGVDANNLNNVHEIPSVTIGAGAHCLHSTEEYCSLDEYVRSCKLLYLLVTSNSP